MKRLVESEDAEGLLGLIGDKVLIMCMNYFYHGKLVGVNKDDVVLAEPKIVYSIGEFTQKTFTTAESLGVDEWLIRTASIESYGKMDK